MELSDAFYSAIERRIEWLTLSVGGGGAIFASLGWGWRAGLGVAVGGMLSWLNFRWLAKIISALLSAAATQPAKGRVHVSGWIYLRFLGRVVLIVIVLYVILRGLWLPGRAILAGFFSLIGAVFLEVGYEVTTGFREPGTRM